MWFKKNTQRSLIIKYPFDSFYFYRSDAVMRLTVLHVTRSSDQKRFI